MDPCGRSLDLEVRQRSNSLLVSWHNVELLAVPAARRELLFATTPVSWHSLESSCYFFDPTLLCFLYFPGLLAWDDTSLSSRVPHLAMLELAVLTVLHSSGQFASVLYQGMIV